MIITEKQQQILEALATYRFLTNSHFMLLGIDQQRSNLSTTLKSLRESKKLIQSIRYRFQEYFHYLTPKGKKLLMNHCFFDAEDISLPSGRNIEIKTDYEHRKGFITCLIHLHQTSKKEGIEVELCHKYYEKLGSNRVAANSRPKSRISFDKQRVDADALFMLSNLKNKELYAFEYERKPDSKRIYRQWRKYLAALHVGEPSKTFKHHKNTKVLYVFESEGIMASVAKRASTDPDFQPFYKFFFFKHKDEVVPHFFKGWQRIDGAKVDVF